MLRDFLAKRTALRAALLLLGGGSASALVLRVLLLIWRRWRCAMLLRDRCVFITGAGAGLGHGLAVGAAARGAATLILCDVNTVALAETRATLLAAAAEESRPLSVHTYACDVSSDAAVKAMAASILATLPPIDVLINNAGVVNGKPLLELTERDVQRTLHINCISNFNIHRHLLPSLVARNAGYVVTIASMMGVVAAAKLSDYCASKSAQIAMHNVLRLEMRRAAPNLRMLLVNPWSIDTGMFAGVATSKTNLRVKIANTIAPMLRPEDVIRRTLDCVEAGESLLVMPGVLRWLPHAIKLLLPPELDDALLDYMGGIDAMDTFTGHRGGGQGDPGGGGD